MNAGPEDHKALDQLRQAAGRTGIALAGGVVRRSSSRFCLGVEHGDYNGTELFGVGTDRFIWLACRPNDTGHIRLFSANFPQDGIVDFALGQVPDPQSPQIASSWARFAMGVDYILHREGFTLRRGIDGIIYGNIPGGGMSRSASLTLNLILSVLEANGIEPPDPLKIVDMAQAVENVYIGSPCGQLDQTMILFAKAGMGTHYDPKTRRIEYIPLGDGALDFRIVVLDTGTDRPGLEKSTYAVRRAECEQFTRQLAQAGYPVSCLADVREDGLFEAIQKQFAASHLDHFARLLYIYHAQRRFYQMLEAWKTGDIETVGRIFRTDGIGLRDEYRISGPELETMCDIARTVEGVLGERMLGGGDKGASGALVRAEAVADLQRAVDTGYPRSCPAYADKYALHICKMVDGIAVLKGVLN
ncbi:MAG: hypothetical protein JW810_02915 [Sedimentisphaerales bacterium]|nr:hypothetical protein [Sedimentisphaerales bacterium]